MSETTMIQDQVTKVLKIAHVDPAIQRIELLTQSFFPDGQDDADSDYDDLEMEMMNAGIPSLKKEWALEVDF